MANGNGNNITFRIVATATAVIMLGITGYLWAVTVDANTARIECLRTDHVNDIRSVQDSLISTDRTVVRIEERLIAMQAKIDDLTATIRELNQRLANCQGCP